MDSAPTPSIAIAAAAVAEKAVEAINSDLIRNEDKDESVENHTLDFSNNDYSQEADEAAALQGLTEVVRDQDDLERDITNQANLAMIEQEDERDQKRIEKVEANIAKLETQRRTARNRLANNPSLRQRYQLEIERLDTEIVGLKKDITDIKRRVEERHQFGDEMAAPGDGAGASGRLPNESQREFLIRTGKITPFSKLQERGVNGQNTLTEALMDAEDEIEEEQTAPGEPRSHQNLRLPGFAGSSEANMGNVETEFSLRPRKKRKVETRAVSSSRARETSLDDDDDYMAPNELNDDLDEEGDLTESDDDMTRQTSTNKRKANPSTILGKVDLASIDDGNERTYQERLKLWVSQRSAARQVRLQHDEFNEEASEDANDEEWFRPCPDEPDYQILPEIKLPGDIYPALFDYQKTGVQWLGELYSQQVGGIVGDEMGLGKTIQVISFLAGLHYSKLLTKPVIIIAPATVLQQWVNEFHRWWPPLRVSILHSSGSGMLNVGNEGLIEDDEVYYSGTNRKQSKSQRPAKKIVDRVVRQGHVLITTYAGLQTYSNVLIDVDWGYAVLDEGHKIRNPNTAITIYCKELKTPNRIILSGTPMQNNLVELWSLFDFVFPMRLGTLVSFRQAFEVPIKLGGYANATNLQILTATKCAETLKEAISPYLLQRLKVDVASDLPKKSEQVLFCKLTKPQREAYEMFLSSNDMASILNRKRQSLYGIDILRKICNHPDLLDPKLKIQPGYKWGNPNKSGKMQVVKALLEMWKRFGHKTLLFSQGVQMLNIIEEFIQSLDGFNYLRMDGSTSIKERQKLVDQFNSDPNLHVFLLTTKVGGLGVNLTGANRVIIFDPDWNPSTDVQARERAWRLGQKKEVTIYRLMTAGTIEEKIYHRQIFKQFLTNKILKDPKQRQTFQMRDLYDLFTLGGNDEESTETGQMFKGVEISIDAPKEPTNSTTATSSQPTNTEASISDSKQGDAINTLSSLAGVAGVEAFHAEDEDDPSAPSISKTSTIPAANDESRIMTGIFARSGVHSLLSHDQIINGKPVLAADRGMLEREARKVAAEAAAALRSANNTARTLAPGTVTWTGEFGSAGRPPANIRRGGARGNAPGSAAILAGLAERQGLSDPPSSTQPSRSSPARAVTGRDFLRLIQEFIRTHGGSVASQALVTHFDRMCRTPQQTAEFKAMLAQIATLERGTNSRMRGRWVLKGEFK